MRYEVSFDGMKIHKRNLAETAMIFELDEIFMLRTNSTDSYVDEGEILEEVGI
jgi:hypothetical protein